jgi:hypothetical protein
VLHFLPLVLRFHLLGSMAFSKTCCFGFLGASGWLALSIYDVFNGCVGVIIQGVAIWVLIGLALGSRLGDDGFAILYRLLFIKLGEEIYVLFWLACYVFGQTF